MRVQSPQFSRWQCKETCTREHLRKAATEALRLLFSGLRMVGQRRITLSFDLSRNVPPAQNQVKNVVQAIATPYESIAHLEGRGLRLGANDQSERQSRQNNDEALTPQSPVLTASSVLARSFSFTVSALLPVVAARTSWAPLNPFALSTFARTFSSEMR